MLLLVRWSCCDIPTLDLFRLSVFMMQACKFQTRCSIKVSHMLQVKEVCGCLAAINQACIARSVRSCMVHRMSCFIPVCIGLKHHIVSDSPLHTTALHSS